MLFQYYVACSVIVKAANMEYIDGCSSPLIFEQKNITYTPLPSNKNNLFVFTIY